MNTIFLVLALAALIWWLEQGYPNVQLPRISGWYVRTGLLNITQALVVLLGSITWELWFEDAHLFSISHFSHSYQVVLGYIAITFVYYWWHRARHESSWLWRFLHQTHHSASRLEVITSFYKHPLEALVNGLLSSVILSIFLGLSPEASSICVSITGIAELFYHMNLKTPHWLGFFFQRPEMHRIHHQRGKHRHNYSDLPLWDMLFGTYSNPKHIAVETGFPNEGEKRILDLLSGRKMKI